MDFKKWDPGAYLRQYYKTPGVAEDERHILQFCVNFLKSANYHFSEMVDIGSGPTIHHLMPFAPYVDTICVSDFLESNLAEIKKWIAEDTSAHDWDPYLRGELEIEGTRPSIEAVEERASLLRNRIKEILHCDIFLEDPLALNKKFPLVTSFYCADSATHSKEAWFLAVQNISSLVEPDGWIIMSALERAGHYKVEDRKFPSAQIIGSDVEDALRYAGFKPDSIVVQTVPISEWQKEGFGGIIVARAQH
ncbi:hypothetical protein KW785_03510, partial [Candidatus Parcubacteria bacterium]|nr:hypothetical protein [Candidatus Parcubacteria bacterium]